LKKITAIFFLLSLVFAFGCKTSVEPVSNEEQLRIDLEKIDNYITEKGITDTLIHASKIRYTINKAGTGIKAKAGDLLRVSYEGRLLESGSIFDSSSSFDFVLNSSSIIRGWYLMVQEMHVGDEFTIYVPSIYAYGRSYSGPGGANSVLIFDIKLIRIGG